MCSFTVDGGGSPVASTLEPIPPNLGGIVLNAAVRNDAIVRPLVTELTDLRSGSTVRLEPPFATRSFPDFVVHTGFHTFTATFPGRGGPERSQAFSLPVELTGSEILSLFLTLPGAEDLRPFAASALADSRLGLAVADVRSTLHRGSTLHVDVDMSPIGDGVGWILVTFPRNRSVTGIRRLPPGETRDGEPLTEHRDFAVAPLENRNALIVRTTDRSARYIIEIES